MKDSKAREKLVIAEVRKSESNILEMDSSNGEKEENASRLSRIERYNPCAVGCALLCSGYDDTI